MTSTAPGAASGADDDWNTHWSAYGESAATNPAQSYRRRLLFAALNLRPGDRLVDIGSGQGDLIRDAMHAQPDIDCLGLELSDSGIEQARRKAPLASFVQADLLLAQSPSVDFDRWGTVATCSEVLEHVDQPEVLLRNACAYLRPGAILVITVPAGPRSAFDRHIGHRRHFSRGSLARTLEGAGLEAVRVQAAGFPFFDLYRLAVVARGNRLIAEANDPDELTSGASGRALQVFDRLFRANLDNTPFGWQLVAVARLPSSPVGRGPARRP